MSLSNLQFWRDPNNTGINNPVTPYGNSPEGMFRQEYDPLTASMPKLQMSEVGTPQNSSALSVWNASPQGQRHAELTQQGIQNGWLNTGNGGGLLGQVNKFAGPVVQAGAIAGIGGGIAGGFGVGPFAPAGPIATPSPNMMTGMAGSDTGGVGSEFGWGGGNGSVGGSSNVSGADWADKIPTSPVDTSGGNNLSTGFNTPPAPPAPWTGMQGNTPAAGGSSLWGGISNGFKDMTLGNALSLGASAAGIYSSTRAQKSYQDLASQLQNSNTFQGFRPEALQELKTLEANPSAYLNSPQVSAARDNAIQILNRQAAVKGQTLSGNLLQDLDNFSKQYDYQAMTNRENQLAGWAGANMYNNAPAQIANTTLGNQARNQTTADITGLLGQGFKFGNLQNYKLSNLPIFGA